ncbi:hypothetical protein BD626DRAFT_542083 [Schizophyllum amplum]|uniref:Uncharacterized protein n=1 Tax=Schizophyllum amplum TaxID=97359 RepID=A0A550BST2_9AGAR|nr:hypothetical protein BD626DRAFT_542083 [Auriculariopsis ampla]
MASQVLHTGELLLNIFEYLDGFTGAESSWLEWPAGSRAQAPARMVSGVCRTWRNTRYGQLASRGEHVVVGVPDDGNLPDGQIERLADYLERGGGRGPLYVTIYLRMLQSLSQPTLHAVKAVTLAFVHILFVHAHRFVRLRVDRVPMHPFPQPSYCALPVLRALEVIVGEPVHIAADGADNIGGITQQYPDNTFFESIQIPTLMCVNIISRSILQASIPSAESVTNLSIVAQHHLSNVFEVVRACPHLRFLHLEEPHGAPHVSVPAPDTPLDLQHLEKVILCILRSHLPEVFVALAGTSVRDLAIWPACGDNGNTWALPPASVTSLTLGIRLTPVQARTLLDLEGLKALVMADLPDDHLQDEAPIDRFFLSALARGRLPRLSVLDLSIQTWAVNAQCIHEMHQALHNRIHHPPAGESLTSVVIGVSGCWRHDPPETALLASLTGPVTLRHSEDCRRCRAMTWSEWYGSNGQWDNVPDSTWGSINTNGWGVASDNGFGSGSGDAN